MTFKPTARGMVTPAGSVPPVDSLKPGKYTLTIKQISEGGERHYVEVEYPNGFTREHHTTGMQDMLEKIINNLRARYGVESVNILQAKSMAEGASIIVEV